MLPSPFQNIDQKIMQSDRTRGTTDNIQPKVSVSDAAFLLLYPCKQLRHPLIPSIDIDGQRTP